jgi:hypothetical protein
VVKSNFPPSTQREHEVAILLGVFASVTQSRGAVYLSAPITSGKRFSNWYEENGKHLDINEAEYHDKHFREVIEPNRLHAKELVQKLWQAFDSVLIDPTAVDDFPGWAQDDYRYFWARVIEKYAHTVVFMDGWQYSLGCSYEFFIACKAGVVTLDENLQPISLDDGINLLNTAIRDMNLSEASSSFLRNVVDNLLEVKGVVIKNAH